MSVNIGFCGCCGGSTSSTSSSGSGGCTCCFTKENGCCGCCCILINANPPYWTQILYAFYTGAGPCNGLGGAAGLCSWGIASNVYFNGIFGWSPAYEVYLGSAIAPGINNALGCYLLDGISNPLLFYYTFPDGFDMNGWCERGDGVVVTLNPFNGGYNPANPPATTLVLAPQIWVFTSSDRDHPAPCSCTFSCGASILCPGFCTYKAQDVGGGAFSWTLDQGNCSGGDGCNCDDASASAYPPPNNIHSSVGFACVR